MSRFEIKEIKARQLVDCKCRPMVEVDVTTADGFLGRGSAPTGTSVGTHEAYVLRDNDPKEYRGLGVRKAVRNVSDIIAPALIGMDVRDQRGIDEKMIALDGTKNKGNLGGNALYSTSVACARAAAAATGMPLYRRLAGQSIKTVPIPSFNLINGGKYRDFTQAFNEFILLPYRAAGIEEAVEIGIDVFQILREEIEAFAGKPPEVAGSFGYAAPSGDPEVVLGLLCRAAERGGYADKVAFALDCASDEMYDADTKTYLLNGRRVTADALIDYAGALSEKFNLVFIEDLLEEDDVAGFARARQRIKRANILGDDFIASNLERLQTAHEAGAVDGFILKPNQIGTITEALDTAAYAHKHNLIVSASGRSGGVVDDPVMDVAVGLQLGFIKNGAPRSGERIDKLNFLMRACDLNPGCALSDISNVIKFYYPGP